MLQDGMIYACTTSMSFIGRVDVAYGAGLCCDKLWDYA